MKILITGGAGFVGSNLAISLKKDNPDYEILCLDNLKRKGSELNIPRLRDKDINFTRGDIRNKEDLDYLNFDTLIECSAEPSVLAGFNESPDYVINTNLVGTLNCLGAVRKNNANIVFISTSRVYPIKSLIDILLEEGDTRFILSSKQNIQGVSEKGISEDFPIIGPKSLYGATKLASELILQEYLEMYDMKGVINRCGLIAGPWQMGKVDQGIIALWIARHTFGGNLSYIGFGGKGKQVRDILHIDDLYNLIKIQLNDLPKFNKKIYNVGGGLSNSISLFELTNLCREITGKKINISELNETRYADITLYITNYSKIKEETGWSPKKSINHIVEETYNWMKSNKKILADVFN